MPYVREPKGLYAPIEYVLSLGGKRIRPVLMLLSYQLYKENVDDILPQAAGIETYHNYTLLHDDLMDCADMRRNKPTVHKVWDENTAILSGDAMLVLAYRLMNNCPERYLKQVMDIFSQTALEICEGQQWDMEFETRNDVTVPEYMEMIRLKTSVLLSAALKIGAVLGNSNIIPGFKFHIPLLSFTNFQSSLTENIHHLLQITLRTIVHQPISQHQHGIPRKNSRILIPNLMHGRLVSAHIRTIHQIIMQQCIIMISLYTCRLW
jgi:hypothetical protein